MNAAPPGASTTPSTMSRLMVDGVVEAPGGAAFTSCVPEYDRDEVLQKEYATSDWSEFSQRWLAS